MSAGRLGLEGTERGLAALVTKLVRRSEIPYEELGGAATLAGTRSASGRRNEFDVVLGRSPDVVVVELKNWRQEVPVAEVMLLFQKVLDHWAVKAKAISTIHPVMACSSGLTEDARRFCFIWGVVPIEPELIPPPLLLEFLDRHDEARALISEADRKHAAEVLAPFRAGVTDRLGWVASNRGPRLRALLGERMDVHRSISNDLRPWLESESGPLAAWAETQAHLLR